MKNSEVIISEVAWDTLVEMVLDTHRLPGESEPSSSLVDPLVGAVLFSVGTGERPSSFGELSTAVDKGVSTRYGEEYRGFRTNQARGALQVLEMDLTEILNFGGPSYLENEEFDPVGSALRSGVKEAIDESRPPSSAFIIKKWRLVTGL